MTEQVKITVRGEQEFAGAEKDVTELVTGGTLTAEENGFTLEYDETAVTGMEGTHTVFRIRPGSVVLCRTGAFRSRMIFEQDKPHRSLYETPHGAMTLDILTRALRIDLGMDGGTLEIAYEIALGQTLCGENCFRILVQPAAPGDA